MVGFFVGTTLSGCDLSSPFGDDKRKLTVTITPEGAGTIDPSPRSYKDGTKVSLTITPNSGWVFDHWEGDLTGSAEVKLVARSHPSSIVADRDADIDHETDFVLSGTESFCSKVEAEISMDTEKNVVAVFKPMTYRWAQIGGPPITLDDPENSTPKFSAEEPGVYAFQLVVDNGEVFSEPDSMSIHVFDVDVVADPIPSTPLKIGKEATVNLTFTYSGLYEENEMVVGFDAIIKGEPQESSSILLVPKDFNVPSENSPAPILRALLGSNIAFVVKAPGASGTVTGTVKFTPPRLEESYDHVLISTYVSYKGNVIPLLVWPLGEDALFYPVTQ
jgi:hypothetical protein